MMLRRYGAVLLGMFASIASRRERNMQYVSESVMRIRVCYSTIQYVFESYI